MRLPIPRRVARIVPEFWARTTLPRRATPGGPRNKEFLARGVFYSWDCCTNVVVRRVRDPDRHLPRAKCTRCRRPQTAFFGAPAQNTRTPEYHIRRNGILDFSCKNAISGKELGISATRGVSAVSPSAALLPSEPKYASRPRYIRERPKEPREEAVQGAGTVAFVLALGAAASGESDAAEVPPRSGA
jgi:hypothetical protein